MAYEDYLYRFALYRWTQHHECAQLHKKCPTRYLNCNFHFCVHFTAYKVTFFVCEQPEEKDTEKFIFIGLILNPNYICCCVSLLLGHLSSFRLHKTIFTISISFLNSHRFVFISKSDYLPVTCKKCMCNVMFLKYNTDLILISHIWLPKIPRTKLVIYLEKRVLLV